jgi:predicted DNA-binding transcriptional regulator AlpA
MTQLPTPQAVCAKQFLTPKAVCAKIAVSRATLDRLVGAGKFPSPIRITPRRLAYNEASVEMWMERMEAA